MLCERKGIEILEGELMPDHIHLLLNIPPKYSIAEIMGYLKSKSTLIIFERHANFQDTPKRRYTSLQNYMVLGSGRIRSRTQDAENTFTFLESK